MFFNRDEYRQRLLQRRQLALTRRRDSPAVEPCQVRIRLLDGSLLDETFDLDQDTLQSLLDFLAIECPVRIGDDNFDIGSFHSRCQLFSLFQ